MSDETMHSLLRRQLKRCFGANFAPPPEWREFLAAVDNAYRESDADRGMLERSLELSSQELLHAGAEMRAVFQAIPDLLVRVDERCHVIECRSGAAGSVQPQGALGTRTELATPHLGPEFRAAVTRAIELQRLCAIEYTLGGPYGPRHYEARLVPVLERQVAAFVRDITERKRAEQELFSSREMFRTILDTIPQRVFWKDRDGAFLGGNRQFATDLGFPQPEALEGRSDYDAFSDDMAEKYRADDREVMDRDRPKLDYEEPMQRPNRRLSWLLTSKVPLHDKDGGVIGILGTYEDITDRKQVESLRAGQNRILEMIATGSPLEETLAALVRLMEVIVGDMRCAIMMVTPDGRRLVLGLAPSRSEEFARAMEEGLLISPDSAGCALAAARKQIVITHDTQLDANWAPLRELTVRFGIRACWSAPVVSSNGAVLATLAMHFSAPRSPSPGEVELLNIAAHIAGIAIERQRAEGELQRTLSLVQSTLESTADGILVVDRARRVVSFNARFLTLWGLPAGAVAQRDDAMTLSQVVQQLREPEGFLRRVQELYDQPEAEGSDVIEFKDGRVFERYSCPQRLDGRPIGRIWSFRDVTQRVRLEEQFRQAQKMDAVGQLAGGVAHDFNNLLTVIIGNLSLVSAGGLMPAQQRAALEDSLSSARRAANLTAQLLTFSRRHALEAKDLDLNHVVTNLTKMLRRLIGEHIVLDTRLVPTGAFVRADRGMLEQLVMNLALNSRDAMPRGGRLTLTTRIVAIRPEELAARPRARAGSFVQLSVADTGTGIAAEHLPRIFEPFFTTKEVGRGTGLGLATVFGIVQQHEGWIEVASPPGAGATFTVFLPRLEVAAVQPIDELRPPRLQRGRETVLLVEDELEVRVLLQKLLEGHGYRVHSARNGTEALNLWRLHGRRFDLLITDLVMPGGMNGRELAERLRADRAELRVIYCSGYTDDMIDGAAPMRARPNFLEKPFDVNLFLERVRRELDAPLVSA